MTKKIYIKNFYSKCCIKLMQLVLEKHKFEKFSVKSSFVEIDEKFENKFLEIIKNEGFEILKDSEEIKVAEIKNAVIELIHYMNNVNSIIRKSDYLIEKMHMSYQQISRLFSKHEKITLEKFIILHKIEKVKRLLIADELTLSEIAYIMDYSSVQHLSNQFKKITGITVSDFRNSKEKFIIPIEEIGNN